MSESILCSNCNNNIGSIMSLYNWFSDYIQTIYLKHEFNGNTPQGLLANPDYKLEFDSLMTAIGLEKNKYCCRKEFLGKVSNPNLFL